MTPVVTSIKIDPDLKQQAQALFESMGLNLSSAVNLFLRQAVREQAIPFRIGEPSLVYTKEEFYNKLEKGIRDIQKGRGILMSLEDLETMIHSSEEN